MTELPEERLRIHPHVRLAPAIRVLDFDLEVQKMRAEAHPPVFGHRQVALVKHGRLTVILFDFEAGGYIPEHTAPGEVVIQAIKGRLEVSVPGGELVLEGGQMLSLAPSVTHAVKALDASMMLLTVSRSGD